MITQIEPLKVKNIRIVVATATAQDVVMGGKKFFIQNTTTGKTAYIKPKNGVVATATNSLVVFSKESTPMMTAGTLSVLGSDAATNLAIVEFE